MPCSDACRVAGIETSPYVPLGLRGGVVAATVGATLAGTTFPLRHSGVGPFISSGGNIYWIGRDSTNTGTVEPHKASVDYPVAASGDDRTVGRANSTVYP